MIPIIYKFQGLMKEKQRERERKNSYYNLWRAIKNFF